MKAKILYLIYVNWIVLRYQVLTFLSVPNDLAELKDSAEWKKIHINSWL